VYEETKLSARLLYFEIKERNNIRVPKNKISKYLKEKGLTTPSPKNRRNGKDAAMRESTPARYYKGIGTEPLKTVLIAFFGG
jgi:hypothetical protein